VIFRWFFPRKCRNKRWVRWETEWSFDGKLCREYSYQKLSRSDNWFSSYSQKCQGCFFETQCIDETRTAIGQDRKVKATYGERHTVWNLKCPERQQQLKYITMFWSCIFYERVGTFVPTGRNIYCCNYVNTLDANLWPGVCKHFAGKHFF